MRCIVLTLALVAAVLATEMAPAELVPVTRPEGRRTGRVTRRPEWVDRSGEPGPAWTVLEGLTEAERGNAAVALDLGPGSAEAWAETRAIENLWNAGRFEAAIERLRGIGRFHDPRDIDVGISWRVPVPTILGTDWGDNIRVGNRDSVYEIELDRNNRTGNLFLASVRDSGPVSVLNVHMSTDAGVTWSETYNMAVSVSYINAIGAVSNGNHFYVSYTRNPNLTLGRVMRFDAATGSQVRFPNDSNFRTMFAADSLDSIQEIAMTSSDDEFPAARIYAMGSTKNRKVEFAFTDSFASNWTELPSNVTWCDGGLSFIYNPYYDTGSRFIWASWIYERTDTLWNVGIWYHDTMPHGFYINPAFEPTYTNTSFAAWHDTLLIAYVRRRGTNRYLSSFLTWTAGTGTWYYNHLPDTLMAREHVNVTGRHGGGFMLAARQYTDPRELVFNSAPYQGTVWGPFLDISDYQPGLADPRLVFIPRGRYGCAYVTWYGTPGPGAVYFNRSDWTGLAESPGWQRAEFGLQARTTPAGPCIRFENPARGFVSLRVYDASGRVAWKRDGEFGAGPQEFALRPGAAGVRFAVLEAAGRKAVAKFVAAE